MENITEELSFLSKISPQDGEIVILVYKLKLTCASYAHNIQALYFKIF
jgi:hypothetical protein